MTILPSGQFRATVDGGHIAYRIVGQGSPIATTHPYATRMVEKVSRRYPIEFLWVCGILG